jgi:hypothetical protein
MAPCLPTYVLNCFFTDRFQCNLLPHLHLPVYCGCFVGYAPVPTVWCTEEEVLQDDGDEVPSDDLSPEKGLVEVSPILPFQFLHTDQY